MTRTLPKRIRGQNRWTGNKDRPGVEAAHAHTSCHDEVRYAVVTAEKRTEHTCFFEAAEEYRIRRASVLTTPGSFENRIADERA